MKEWPVAELWWLWLRFSRKHKYFVANRIWPTRWVFALNLKHQSDICMFVEIRIFE